MVMGDRGFVYVICSDPVQAKQFAMDNQIDEEKMIVLSTREQGRMFRHDSVGGYDEVIVIGPITPDLVYLRTLAQLSRLRRVPYDEQQEMWREAERKAEERASQSAQNR